MNKNFTRRSTRTIYLFLTGRGSLRKVGQTRYVTAELSTPFPFHIFNPPQLSNLHNLASLHSDNIHTDMQPLTMQSYNPSSSSPFSWPTSPSQSPPNRSSKSGSSSRRRRVSAEHTLTRVRENQRRHRAKRRSYMTELEEKLQDTQRELGDAKKEIEQLKKEREIFGSCFRSHCSTMMRNEIQTSSEEDAQPESTVLGISTPMSILTPISTVQEEDAMSRIDGPPPCCEDSASDGEIALARETPSASPECSTCATRPPPSPTESTTLCSQAYVMIQQQNFRGIDAIMIRTWLSEGLRSAQRKGEGCRVENSRLLSLLDFISGI